MLGHTHTSRSLVEATYRRWPLISRMLHKLLPLQPAGASEPCCTAYLGTTSSCWGGEACTERWLLAVHLLVHQLHS